MNEWKKICEDCGCEQLYSTKYKLERALIEKSSCRQCARKRPQKHRQNLDGKTFGKLTVISFLEKRGTQQYWKCRCICGKETNIRHTHLTKQTIRSCGCSHLCLKETHPRWVGIGEIPGSYISSTKKSADVRGLAFNITKEQMWELFLKQNKKCALTGVDLQFQSRRSLRDGTASLDRIDSDKAYEIDNVQWVHKVVNSMKQDLKEVEFVNWCKLIVDKNYVAS